MIEPIPFVPDRFRSAAPHYLAGRPAYAPALIRRVAQLCGLDGTGRLLDLGCGPGQLAVAFAPFVAGVLAVDPEPAMMAAGQNLAGSAAVTFRQGSSQDLDPSWGRFRAVTIGRAFHWMDRVETARRLDGMIEPGGALVLFHVDHPAVPDNAWREAYQAALDAALGEGTRSTWRGSRLGAERGCAAGLAVLGAGAHRRDRTPPHRRGQPGRPRPVDVQHHPGTTRRCRGGGAARADHGAGGRGVGRRAGDGGGGIRRVDRPAARNDASPLT